MNMDKLQKPSSYIKSLMLVVMFFSIFAIAGCGIIEDEVNKVSEETDEISLSEETGDTSSEETGDTSSEEIEDTSSEETEDTSSEETEDTSSEEIEDTSSEETEDTSSPEINRYELTVTVNGSGATSPAIGTYSYDDGEEVEIEAIADAGYQFVNWNGDSALTDSVISVTIDQNTQLIANFELVEIPVVIDPNTFTSMPLQSQVDQVQPYSGIVLWADSWNGNTIKTTEGNIQLEYAYMRPSDVVTGDDQYDWSSVEVLLDEIAGRSNQAILRWYYVYPGDTDTAVPDYIKALSDYNETIATSEGSNTAFPDWSHSELQAATLDFYTAFAAQYDGDPRLAYLQVGFGLWGEYHIYDPGEQLGVNFPSKAYQTTFLTHLANTFEELHWSISIDAGDSSNTPISSSTDLLALEFGNFDDSFMHDEHDDYNEDMWEVFGYTERYKHSPHGGELSYYSDYDQEHVLDSAGMYGRTYETLSAKFHIGYMIGNDQPNYQTDARIKEAGMANGYVFEVTQFKTSDTQALVTVINNGITPIYYDAYVAVNGVRATESLKPLLPGESAEYLVESGGSAPELTIESDHLVVGQEIQFNADL